MEAKLLCPLRLRSLTLKNRIVISPMCQYSAVSGRANDWHMVQYGRFALGGAGLVFLEATAVEKQGRITHGDLGLWEDSQIPALRRITEFLKGLGAVPGIQLSHAGRRAGSQRPWHGAGPLGDEDLRLRGEAHWETVAPSPIPANADWRHPRELGEADLERLREAFHVAARRALAAGFEVIELHCAHGYLLHQFLSPLSNHRRDDFGGSRERRCRFPLEIATMLRQLWPKDKPVFVRVSAVDGLKGGLTLADTVYFAERLKACGVDVIDCSSGGLVKPAVANSTARSRYGFQVPYAEAVRRKVGVATMAVGLIIEPRHAEDILQKEQADLIAIGREALLDPNWPLHARFRLLARPDFDVWPEQMGWWLANRARRLEQLES